MEATESQEFTAPVPRRKVYFDGTEVEVWENPDVHFGATPADLKGFFNEGSWVALFNAMALASRPEHDA